MSAAKSTARVKSQGKELHFEVPEFAYHEKDLKWYIVALIVFAAVIVAAVFINDIRLAIIIVLGAAAIYQIGSVHPKKRGVILSGKGLTYGEKFYPWSVFRSFTVLGDSKHASVHLDKLSYYSGALTIVLPRKHITEEFKLHSVNPEVSLFLAFLRSYLPEKVHSRMPAIEYLNRLLKF